MVLTRLRLPNGPPIHRHLHRSSRLRRRPARARMHRTRRNRHGKIFPGHVVHANVPTLRIVQFAGQRYEQYRRRGSRDHHDTSPRRNSQRTETSAEGMEGPRTQLGEFSTMEVPSRREVLRGRSARRGGVRDETLPRSHQRAPHRQEVPVVRRVGFGAIVDFLERAGEGGERVAPIAFRGGVLLWCTRGGEAAARAVVLSVRVWMDHDREYVAKVESAESVASWSFLCSLLECVDFSSSCY
mmetsp:Transcript_7414/g.14071  ORF Transcript_7414/g.14071 Transcript_7414/m.14071 type:complete len:241 (+) Transcript_7414:181-903(+)